MVIMLSLHNELLDYPVEKATPQEILAFKASPEAQAYAQELLERQSAGRLTPEDAQILAQMEQVERLMSVLKAKALRSMSRIPENQGGVGESCLLFLTAARIAANAHERTPRSNVFLAVKSQQEDCHAPFGC